MLDAGLGGRGEGGFGDRDVAEGLVDCRQQVADSFTPEAAALAWTCSGREAPVMAEATSPRRRTQASARVAMLIPASSAMGTKRCTASKVASL
ncbi:hypothetical protein GCM10011428_35350 [Streptomyces violaceus]